MNEIRVGIVACASMHEQIKECVTSLEGSFKLYPLVPPCTFNMKSDLMRYYLDRSIVENDVTILAYGLCHPEILALLADYGDRVVRLRGSNCYEMFLGTEKYAEYHQKCYWMLNKPFFTRYKRELLAGFEAGTNNGKMLIGDTYKKLVYLSFDTDQLDIDLVEDFASTFGLEYEIHSADTVNLKRLLEEAVASASPTGREKSLKSSRKYPDKSDIRTILENIPEVVYNMDIHTKKFTFISPQVERIFGYTRAEFTDIMNDDVLVPFYHEEDREQVIAGRYNFILKCLNKGMQELYEVEYHVKHKRGNVLWVRESVYPYYSSEGIIESFVGKIADISKRKCLELERENLLKIIETAREAMNITSPDGIMTYTNPAMDDLFGYERGELIGKSPSILNAGPEPVAVMKDIMRAIEKKGIWEGEIHNKRKDGMEFISYARISAVKDKKGELINFVSTQHDITERKRLDEVLKKAYNKSLQE